MKKPVPILIGALLVVMIAYLLYVIYITYSIAFTLLSVFTFANCCVCLIHLCYIIPLIIILVLIIFHKRKPRILKKPGNIRNIHMRIIPVLLSIITLALLVTWIFLQISLIICVEMEYSAMVINYRKTLRQHLERFGEKEFLNAIWDITRH